MRTLNESALKSLDSLAESSEERNMKTDSELQRDVVYELEWEPGVDAADIGVSVEDGVVRLNGVVRSLTEKWTAERAAQRVEGVRAVTDGLAVVLPGDARDDDAEIARAAATALDWYSSVPRERIKILVKQRRITLEGEVEHSYQKDAAEGAVRNLAGVEGVDNMITVKPGVSEADVKYSIFKALERAAEAESQNITVETRGGCVILRGTAKTWAERDEAERAAWAAPGVNEVQNQIQVAA